jgi:hypothetical protein
MPASLCGLMSSGKTITWTGQSSIGVAMDANHLKRMGTVFAVMGIDKGDDGNWHDMSPPVQPLMILKNTNKSEPKVKNPRRVPLYFNKTGVIG